MADGHRLDAGERRLGRRLGRAEQPLEPDPPRALRDGEHAADAAQPPVERELPDRRVPLELLARHLLRRGEHGERDRQVEAGALLAQAGRREVDGDAAARPLQLGGGDAAAHALARLLARLVRQPDDRERRHLAVHVRLHLDPPRLEPDERVRDRACKHTPTLRGHLSRLPGALPAGLPRHPYVLSPMGPCKGPLTVRGVSSHAASALAEPSDGLEELVLVGHPNVGKSVLFRRLTGRYVNVSNYPGTTVDVFRGAARTIDGATVVDTPGIVGFPARSEDEQVVSRLLLDGESRTVVQVGDAKSIRRTIQLTAQLAELGLPLVLVLNMADEAGAAGVHVDRERLAELLGLPVLLTVATAGTGVAGVAGAAAAAPPARPRVAYPAPVERALAELAAAIDDAPVAPRGLGLLWLGGDEDAAAWLERRLPAGFLARLRERAELELGEPAAAALQRARLAYADEIAAAAVRQERPRDRGVLERIGRLSTHRLWGWPILAAVLYAVYWFVGVVGAGRLVGLLESSVFGRHVNPWLTHEVTRLVPSGFVVDFLVGKYGLWTMGMTYALALILPIVTTFFLVFGVLEDSGYLPRLAVMSNRLFHALGLNGKAALPMVLGLGCVTMATLTTRILESRRERLLATLLLALGIPCSAQLGVVLGMLGSISPVATLIWAGVVATVVFAVGWLAAAARARRALAAPARAAAAAGAARLATCS